MQICDYEPASLYSLITISRYFLLSFIPLVYLYEVLLSNSLGPLYTHFRGSTGITDIRTLYQHAFYQRTIFRGRQLVYNCHAVRWASSTLERGGKSCYILEYNAQKSISPFREKSFIPLNFTDFNWLITMDEVSSSFNVLLLTQLTNLLRCSKCCFISVANTMSMMVSLRGVYSSLVRFLKMLTELSFHESWKPKAAWWFSRTALEKQQNDSIYEF